MKAKTDTTWKSIVCVALFLVGACAPPPVPSPVESPPNLILITIDTLRADHLGCYGYFRDTSPHLDQFAADALLFERAFAPIPTTLPSHVSMFTGTAPVRHRVVSNYSFLHAEQPATGLKTAAQMLRQSGYRTAAFTSSSPLSAATGINLGFDTFEGPPMISHERGRIDRKAQETVDAALNWLEGARLEETPAPFFLWVHLFDPHDPYQPPQPFRGHFEATPELDEYLERLQYESVHHGAAREAIDPYDAEIFYADREIGRLLQNLEARGLYESSFLVFTADHGEGLMQHGEPRHTEIWNEQLQVPLVIRLPKGPRGRVASLASVIDILPTLAGGGLPLDASQFDGVDLLQGERRDVLAQRAERRGVGAQLTLTGQRFKYWFLADGPDRLYDLESDPHETRDVIVEHPEVAQRMRKEIERRVATSRQRSSLRVGRDVPEGIKQQLRTLGYLE